MSPREPTGFERDYIGYGRNPPQVEWPGGARVAVNLVVNYEAGSERSYAAGDNRNESIGEIPRPVDPGIRDLGMESVYEFESRAGVWRLLRLFDRYNLKCTFFAAAVALERNPDVGAWIKEAGHEPCSHGYRWEEEWNFSREEMRARIEMAVKSIEKTCGERPVGWYSRWMPSLDHRELLVEERGFIYDSNSYNDELPYYVRVLGRPFLVVPFTQLYNDGRFFLGGMSSPTDFVDYCCRALDYLWEEGETHPKMMSVGLHPRWIGQAGRTSALKEFIEHALKKRDVWFARRCDIARWWLDRYPPADSAVPARP